MNILSILAAAALLQPSPDAGPEPAPQQAPDPAFIAAALASAQAEQSPPKTCVSPPTDMEASERDLEAGLATEAAAQLAYYRSQIAAGLTECQGE
jgi:hypothetical protein